MEYQSFGRLQRPKGTNIKQAIKVVLVLAVCVWLSYQIKHSRNNTESNFSAEENDGDENQIIREKETRTQKNLVVNATNSDVAEEIDEFQSFHDENGVPPDGDETGITFGQAHILHEENISSVSKGSWPRKYIYEVTFGDDNNVEVNSEVSKDDAIAGEEINVDTSDIKTQFGGR